MGRGALYFHDVFLRDVGLPKMDPDYVTETKSNDTQGCFRNLYAGILIRAVKDLIGRCKRHRDSAGEWLGSDNNHISSFRHICDILDLDVQKVREKIRVHIERKNAGLPGTINIPYLRG